KQLERFDWQLRILKEADGNPERAELLREHADEEVKTEAGGGAARRNTKKEKTELTDTFQAAESVLKGQVEQLSADLHVYNELRRRVDQFHVQEGPAEEQSGPWQPRCILGVRAGVSAVCD
ncbi:hypothetical protein KUCAC02_004141, partial [Chaenocephalus aceratus]